MMRASVLLKSLVLSTALLAGYFTSSALAVSTIPWTGDSNFNAEAIYFSPIKADELTGITGLGQYEACCDPSKKTTSFSMYLLVSEGKDNKPYWTWNWNWQLLNVPWGKPGDETPFSMATLISQPITFNNTPLYVAGIYLTSDPNGHTEKPGQKDPYNFTNFSVVTFLSRDEYYEKYKSKYPNRKAFDDCDDYEKYIRNLTSFQFDIYTNNTTGETSVPLPAALPLMGSVLGGFGFAMWRRRRKRSA